mgnify:CR=1 FL=1
MFANPFYKESPDKTPNQDPEDNNNTRSQSAEKDVLGDITEPSVDVSNITDNQKQQFNNPFGDQQAVIFFLNTSKTNSLLNKGRRRKR